MTSAASGEARLPATPIAGFWRRLAAFAIDGVILLLPTLAIYYLAFDAVVSLGEAGRLIGLAAALAYFGLMNGPSGDGQTVGKSLMEIRVVNRDGEVLSTPRSMARFLVLGIPYFLNGLFFEVDIETMGLAEYALGALMALIVFGGLGATVYLYVFNRRTRQTLHDLAVGSFVVRAEPEQTPVPATLTTPRLHLIVVACWGVLLLGLMIVGNWAGRDSNVAASLAPLLELQRAIRAEHGIQQVGVHTTTTTMTTSNTGTSSVTALKIVLRPSAVRSDTRALQLAVAKTVLARHPDLMGQQILSVSVLYVANLGIINWTKTLGGAWNAAEWRAEIAAAGG